MGTIVGSGWPAGEGRAWTRSSTAAPGRGRSASRPQIGGGGIYKARPLNGIWATALYLHNGSVPTLDDLLKPADKRPKSFTVAAASSSRTRSASASTPRGYPLFVARTPDGKPVPGNSNEGHEDFTPDTPRSTTPTAWLW
ncbi:MAG: hypothetical protein WKF75_00775 [Singulisphaera sp.]